MVSIAYVLFVYGTSDDNIVGRGHSDMAGFLLGHFRGF